MALLEEAVYKNDIDNVEIVMKSAKRPNTTQPNNTETLSCTTKEAFQFAELLPICMHQCDFRVEKISLDEERMNSSQYFYKKNSEAGYRNSVQYNSKFGCFF